MNPGKILNPPIWAERFAIAIVAGLYLYVFRTVAPNGDGMVYITHIENSRFVWNPNHLLMDPAGNGFCHLLWSFGADISTFHALKLLSSLATILSLILFHAVVVKVGISSPWIRIASVSGLFFSRNFLSMALSEEFFMVQMPFLLLALLIYVRWSGGAVQNHTEALSLLGLGGFLGIATLISMSNVFLIMTLGVCIATIRVAGSISPILRAPLMWLGTAAIMLPGLLLGFHRTEAASSFLTWLTAYQGRAGNVSRSLYGVEWNPKGIAMSLSRLIYNLFANFIDLGGLGTILKSRFFGIPLEHKPDFTGALLAGSILIGLVVLGYFLASWIRRKWRAITVLQFGLAWVLGILLFNLYWNDSSDQFYFQVLPIAWVWIALALQDDSPRRNLLDGCGGVRSRISAALLPILVLMIMLLNTIMVAAPPAFDDIEGKRNAHRRMLQAGDLEIAPGWDGLQWMSTDERFPPFQRMLLMDLAMQSRDGGPRIEQLPKLIHTHLSEGKRVIIARLYDQDGVARPWDQLRKLGWPRARIMKLVEGYESREIGRIGDVIFREVYLNPPPESGSDGTR
jgi:hypothetical protein